jgi:hypothetical protein
MNHQKLNYKVKKLYLTNFLPLVVTNLLKKGEKEKTFVKVSKVLRRLKITNVLNNSFLINKRIFLNKILIFLRKNENKEIFINNKIYFNSIDQKNTRNFLNYFTKSRISFSITNIYHEDFFEFSRNSIYLKKQIEKINSSSLKKKKIKIIVRKKFSNLIFFLSKNKFFGKVSNEIFSLNNRYLSISHQNYDLNILLSRILKKLLLFSYMISFFKKLSQKIYKNYCNKIFSFSKLNFFSNIKKKNLLIRLNFKRIKQKIIVNSNKNILFKKKRKYYYLSKKTRLLKKQHKILDLKYFKLKKKGKKMPRFEFKKRKILFKKLLKGYNQSRSDFFKFKRNQNYKKYLKFKKQNNNLNKQEIYGKSFGLKLIVEKKELKSKSKNIRRKFFKYSIFPTLYSPIKFLNIVLSYYRLYFTFREQRLWSKQQRIPTILNLKRDIRITTRNFKKSLKDDRFTGLNFETSFFESLLLAGARKGFLLKVKRQAYIFMIKNAIFLQFMVRKRNAAKRKRRKKVDRK